MATTYGLIKLRIVTRDLKSAKAAAAMDSKGRVLVLVNSCLPRHMRTRYSLWGILQWLKFRFCGTNSISNRDKETPILNPGWFKIAQESDQLQKSLNGNDKE